MSALAFVETVRGWEDAGSGGTGAEGTGHPGPAQPRLFALPGGAVEDAAPAAREAAQAPAEARGRAVAPVRTLDDVLGRTWATVSAGETATCPLCSGPLLPRWSAGAGVVGGRCANCGTDVD
jgi:hypothetical protein